MSGDGHRLQLRFLYLREPPLWPLSPPPPCPPFVALGSQPCAHTDPHSSSYRAGVIYRAMQAGHGQGRTLAPFTGRPRPWAHSSPKPAPKPSEPPHFRRPGDLFRDGAVSGPQWIVDALYSSYLLPSLSRAQDKIHPGILRPLPQREGTAHPAAPSLKSCSPTHPPHPSSSSFSSSSLPPPSLASCSLGTAPRQTLSLSRCPHAWASPPGGGVGWFLKGPVQHPLLSQQGFPGVLLVEKSVSEEEGIPAPTPTRYPPLLHIFCAWPPCRLERDRRRRRG